MANGVAVENSQDLAAGGKAGSWRIPGEFPNNNKIWIRAIYVNNEQRTSARSFRVKKGDILQLVGAGLGAFDSARFFTEKVTAEYRSDNILTFRIPNLSSLLGSGRNFQWQLISTSPVEFSQTMSPDAVYLRTDEEAEEKTKPKTATEEFEEKQVAEGKSKPLNSKTQTQAVQNKASNNNQAKTANQIKQTNTSDDDQEPDETQENIYELDSKPSEVRESFGLVRKYISENPNLILDNQVKMQVLTALQTGNLASLSQTSQTALRNMVSINSQGQAGGASARLSRAFEVVGSQMASGGGSVGISGTASSSVTGSVATKTEAEAKIEQNAKIDSSVNAQVSESKQAEAKVSANLDQQVGVRGGDEGVKTSAPGGASVQPAPPQTQKGPEAPGNQGAARGEVAGPSAIQKPSQNERNDMDEVAKQISENRALIPNERSKDEVLKALGRGNVSNLSPAAQTNYDEALRALSVQKKNGEPTKGAEAAKNLLGSEGGLDEPQAKGDSGAEKEEGRQGLEGEKPKPPAGFENLAKNDANIGQKLGNLTANKDKISDGQTAPKGIDGPKRPGRGAVDGLSSGAAVSPQKNSTDSETPPSGSTEPNGPASSQKPSELGVGQQEAQDEDEDSERQDQEEIPPVPTQPQLPQTDAVLAKEIDEAARLANTFINDWLISWAIMAWSFSLVTFGLSILAGAIIGDLLWALKKPLIRFAVGRIKLPLLKGDLFKRVGDQLGDKIKFNLAVKANIVSMNLVIFTVVFVLILIFTGVLWYLCNDWVYSSAMWVAGYGSTCSAINSIGQ